MTPELRLRAMLEVVAGDVLFAVLGLGPRSIEPLQRRRGTVYETAGRRGEAKPGPREHVAWIDARVRAAASFATPWFVPMHGVVAEMLSLDREPQGLRALVPIGLEALRERTRREAMYTARVVRAVAAADGVLSPAEHRALALLRLALALPEEDVALLEAEPTPVLEHLEVPATLQPALARALVGGAFEVAACDGLDPREKGALEALATQFGLDVDALAELGHALDRSLAERRQFAEALLDVLRYVLAPLAGGDPATDRSAVAEVQPWLELTLRLAAPTDALPKLLGELQAAASTPLSRELPLAKQERTSVLAACWAVVMTQDPTSSARVVLGKRLDRAAHHLGSERLAEDARGVVEGAIFAVLERSAAYAGA